MAKITKSSDRIGKFTRSAHSAPPPVTADIRHPGDFADGVAKAVAQARDARTYLHDASDASQRHPTKRIGSKGGRSTVESDRDEGGAYTVTPAGSIDELQHQVQLLIDAFVRAEGRKPTARDSGFWGAYAEVVQAYEQKERLGSVERITEPLNADPNAKPDRRKSPPHAPPKSGETALRKQRATAIYQILEMT